MSLDVSSINSIEGLFLSNLANGFSLLTLYARHLLYYFTAFEIIFCGFAWALYQNQIAERLFVQLIKIGLILFLVDHFVLILNSVLGSLILIGTQLSPSGAENILLNPGLIWSYGYNFSVSLLQAAATSDGFALPMILLVLGFGILCTVAVLGIQIFIQVVAFYLVAAMSLLFIPLSVFSPLQDFFSQSVKSVLQASIRLMVQLMIVSAAVSVWSAMHMQSYNPNMNINTPLGFLFTGLLFVLASAYLPKFAAAVIGSIKSTPASVLNPTVQISAPPTSSAMTIGNPYGTSSFATIQAAAMMTQVTPATALTTQAPPSVTVYTQTIKGDFLAKQLRSTQSALGNTQQQSLKAQQKEDIKKIKQAFYEVLKETTKD